MPPSVTHWLRDEHGALRRDVSERFWSKVSVRWDHECWPWQGALHGGPPPYGVFWLSRDLGTMPAHRVAYELVVGRIPDGAVLDHICRNRPCMNPAHLRPASNRDNIVAGIGPSAVNAEKTHCRKGHPLSGANLKMEGRFRRCRQCTRERKAKERGHKAPRWFPIKGPVDE